MEVRKQTERKKCNRLLSRIETFRRQFLSICSRSKPTPLNCTCFASQTRNSMLTNLTALSPAEWGSITWRTASIFAGDVLARHSPPDLEKYCQVEKALTFKRCPLLKTPSQSLSKGALSSLSEATMGPVSNKYRNT